MSQRKTLTQDAPKTVKRPIINEITIVLKITKITMYFKY